MSGTISAQPPLGQNEEDFAILSESVNEKTYSAPNATLTDAEVNSPIPEPSFIPPPLTEQKEEIKKESPEEIRAKKHPEPVNPAMNYLDKKEQVMAAEKMADLFIMGYKKLHQLGNNFLQIKPEKLNKLHMEGKINLNKMVNYSIGMEMPARDFFNSHNEQMKDFLTVDDEFVEAITPPLVRILSKKGIGLTDENQVAFLIGEDVITKSFLVYQQKSVINNMIKHIGIATTAKTAYNAPPPPPPPVQEPAYAPPPTEAKKSTSNATYTEAEILPKDAKTSSKVRPNMIVIPKKEKTGAKRGRKPKQPIEIKPE